MDNRFELDDEIDDLEVAEFFDEYEDYIYEKLIPQAVAKYLAIGYQKNFISPYPVKNHFNTAIDVFNLECDFETIIPIVEQILSEKYNLKIVDYQTTKLEKINK